MDDIRAISHIVNYGRPLWLEYAGMNTNTICICVAKQLLCDGEDNTTKPTHLFAVLFASPSLDLCMQSNAVVGP
jgi:hypothetical protein